MPTLDHFSYMILPSESKHYPVIGGISINTHEISYEHIKQFIVDGGFKVSSITSLGTGLHFGFMIHGNDFWQINDYLEIFKPNILYALKNETEQLSSCSCDTDNHICQSMEFSMAHRRYQECH